jgi:hypothetical protein
MKGVESMGPADQLPDDEQRPAIAQYFSRFGHGTVLIVGEHGLTLIKSMVYSVRFSNYV